MGLAPSFCKGTTNIEKVCLCMQCKIKHTETCAGKNPEVNTHSVIKANENEKETKMDEEQKIHEKESIGG
jgi:hypothetical protein